MHYYACPYCAPCPEAHLFLTKDKSYKCGHKQGFFNKDKECKEQKYTCKKVWKCRKCKEQWVPSETFMKEQKRKIKDG